MAKAKPTSRKSAKPAPKKPAAKKKPAERVILYCNTAGYDDRPALGQLVLTPERAGELLTYRKLARQMDKADDGFIETKYIATQPRAEFGGADADVDPEEWTRYDGAVGFSADQLHDYYMVCSVDGIRWAGKAKHVDEEVTTEELGWDELETYSKGGMPWPAQPVAPEPEPEPAPHPGRDGPGAFVPDESLSLIDPANAPPRPPAPLLPAVPRGVEPLFECQNCLKRWDASQLKELQDVTQRVEAGELMPAGECPECGAVCHQVPYEEAPHDVPAES